MALALVDRKRAGPYDIGARWRMRSRLHVASRLLKAGRASSMTHIRFYDAASGLLTPEAFSFMVSHLLRHAERTQEFLTLVVFVAERASRDAIGAVDESVLTDIGRLISRVVRKTDLLARTADGMLSLMLSGIDVERAMAVIERLNEQMWRYRMSPALQISVGAACCPTHAIHADELLQAAISRRVHGDRRYGPRIF